MLSKKKCLATVIKANKLTDGIYELWLETEIALGAMPGAFIAVYPKNASTLLPRPISICEVNENKTQLRLVYRVAGAGTTEFASYKEGDTVYVLGILGNGYPIKTMEHKEIMLMGGGIGIPPMLELAKSLKNSKLSVVLGYRDQNLFLKEEFEKYATVYVATEDGSIGTKGNVLDVVREEKLNAKLICGCGPMPMLRAIKAYAAEKQIPAYISLEERMACGVGACLGCVCKTKNVDHHSYVNNARICTDGPVFLAEDVEI